MIFYVIFSFIIVIAFLFIVWFVPAYRSEISKIPVGLENYLLTQRFLNSPLCFTLQDKDTNRVYPLTIDLSKFNQENLDRCYNVKDTNVKAYRLTLNYGTEKKTISTKNWGGFLKKAQTKDIFIYNNGETQRGELFVEMQDVK